MTELKKPKVRFRGFTDAWEQRKLGEYKFYISDGNYGELYPKANEFVDEGVPFIRVNNLKNGYLTHDGLAFISAELHSILLSGHIKTDDILITNRGQIGLVAYVDDTFEDANINAQICLIRTEKKMNSCYLHQFLQTEGCQREIVSLQTGTALKQLPRKKLDELLIKAPTNIEEQAEIGAYFRKLDYFITLHQRKCDGLQRLKKSMLQKMFPQNGANVPEIRFAGFTDAWEQRKLGEVADIVGGGTPSTAISDYWDGDIDWYAPAEIADQIYVKSSQRKITEQGYNNSSAKMLPIGTVLFTSRAGIGKTAILAHEGCTNQGFQSIVPHKGKLDSYFIFSRTDEMKKYGETVGAGSTFVEVSGKQMANMELMLPKTIDEQRVIGSYFESLDHLITLHQRKLDTLKNIKKSMLTKMFI